MSLLTKDFFLNGQASEAAATAIQVNVIAQGRGQIIVNVNKAVSCILLIFDCI